MMQARLLEQMCFFHSQLFHLLYDALSVVGSSTDYSSLGHTTRTTCHCCRVYFMTRYTGLTSLKESSRSSLSLSACVWRTKLRSTWASIALRLPSSAADIYDQPTSVSWLYCIVSGLHSTIGLSLWQAWRSGTHYRLSFVTVCQFWRL